MRERPLKILHGPVNVGNQPWTLSREERKLGASSDLIVNYGTWLQYPADRTLGTAGDKSLAYRARRYGFGLGAAWSYDVLHYYFGRTFTMPDGYVFGQGARDTAFIADAKAARLLGKRIFMTLQGCDARIAKNSNTRSEWTMCANGRCSVYQTCVDSYDRQRQSMIDTLLPLCDRVFYLNPEIGHEVPNATFMPYANVDIDAVSVAPVTPNQRAKIVHAPSNGPIKGTDTILAALEQLRSRFEFDLVLVQNKSHAEAMEIYKSADLAIDQILAGWYGGFAVELMAMGKPVAAYIREQDLGFLDPGMRADIAVLQLRPDKLIDDLATILEQRLQWPELGVRARRYVERWHNPSRIARAMLACYAAPQLPFTIPA